MSIFLLNNMKLLITLCFGFCCLQLLLRSAVAPADPHGFVSVDCGYNGPDYTDNSTGLTWKSDSSFFDPTGNSVDSSILTVNPPSSNSPNYFTSVRYFTGNRTKYCYVFDGDNAGVELDSAYLVRASFWAGQYASSAPPPGTKQSNASRIFFQIYINADPWDDVLIDVGSPQPSSPVVKEMYLVVNYSSEIAVCLGGPGVPGIDSPFISSLELRLLSSNMDVVGNMIANSRHLFTLHLVNYGSSSSSPIRYPNDKFDRIWGADTERPSLSTTGMVSSDLYEIPPLDMLQTARDTDPSGIGFNVTLDLRGNSLIKGPGTRGYYYYFFMAEISPNVTTTGQRVFDIRILHGDGYSSSATGYDIMNKTGNQSFTARGWYSGKIGFYTDDLYEQGSFVFSFVRSNGSEFGPLLNGLQLLLAADTEPSAGTIAADVNALQAIKATFPRALASWQGDPCLPYAYNWISCDKNERPAIISLSLANQNLSGEIPSSIANLTSLSTLDLQGNQFNGTIPEFLATLSNLKFLLLQNNNFSGVIPAKLLEKQSNSGLQINVNGNPFLCNSTCSPQSTSSTNPRKSNTKPMIVGVTTSMVGIIVVFVCLAFYLWRKRHLKDKHVSPPDPLIIPTPNKPRSFSYSEVEEITNNFSHVLGEGGFGKVFHGVLDKTNHVAVKILSTFSTQGMKEFLNEVNLLTRVHHRNLVRLLGYCIECQVMLIYEYMPNGSLEKIIHGVPPHNHHLSWSDRLKILVDAAQGINYLHNGCTPAIIHRDLKPANILIDKDMYAKISDFGISRSNYETQERSSNFATTVKGSTAYMAPEYIGHGHIDEKIDVYAFGILILEVISGKSPIHAFAKNKMQHIKYWVKPLFEAGKLNEIIDRKMSVEHFDENSIWKVLGIAMACIDQNSTLRPTMEEVAQELKSILQMGSQENIHTTNSHFSTSIVQDMDAFLR